MKIGAVIVTYSPRLTDLSILVSNIVSAVEEIVIVDNGSKNLIEIQNLSKQHKKIKIISLSENKGIGFAQNRGIERIFSDDEIGGVVLFDHDSHPELDMVSVLSREYERLTANGERIGALGPVYIDPRTQNYYPIVVFSGFTLKKKYPKRGDEAPIPASFIIASGSLIPRSTYGKVGGMNEGFFIDYIDIEWGFRTQACGYKLYACPGAKMFHQIGDSRFKILGREISIHSPLRRYYLARNSIFMLKIKYIDWRYKFREFFYSVSRVIVFIIFVNKRFTYLKYILRGWYDGIIGKSGVCSI